MLPDLYAILNKHITDYEKNRTSHLNFCTVQTDHSPLILAWSFLIVVFSTADDLFNLSI